jgi:hypothetical protein
LVYGSNDPVPISAITYGGGTLEVTVGWQNQALSEDANNNGSVEPLDALIIINKLNAEGFHELQHPADAYPNEPNGYCWDTNGDGWVAPIDALRVINYINNPPGGGLGAASRDMQDSSAGASIASVPAAITPVVVPRAGASGRAEKTISTPEPLPFASAVSSVGPSSSGLPSKRSGSAARSKPAHTSADVLSVAPAETASFPAPADPSLMERPLVLVSPQAGQVPAGSSSLRAAELEPECLVDVLAMARLELPLMA